MLSILISFSRCLWPVPAWYIKHVKCAAVQLLNSTLDVVQTYFSFYHIVMIMMMSFQSGESGRSTARLTIDDEFTEVVESTEESNVSRFTDVDTLVLQINTAQKKGIHECTIFFLMYALLAKMWGDQAKWVWTRTYTAHPQQKEVWDNCGQMHFFA